MWACGGHVTQVTAMNDVLETVNHRRFLLHGRMDDLINIAGKRSSLAYLNHQLLGIPGVTPENEDPAYYEDTYQFRPGRSAGKDSGR